MSYLISCHCSDFQRTHSLSTRLMNELPEKTLWRNSASKRVDVGCSPDASVRILKTDIDSPALYPALRHWPLHSCFDKAGLEELQFQLRNCHARNSAPVLQSLKNTSVQGRSKQLYECIESINVSVLLMDRNGSFKWKCSWDARQAYCLHVTGKLYITMAFSVGNLKTSSLHCYCL